MGTQWYVLQVMTGQELAIRYALQRLGIQAKVPSEDVPLLRGGRLVMTNRLLFKSYVFLGCDELDADIYYAAVNTSGVLRILGTPKPEPITQAEAEWLNFLAPTDKPLQPSILRMEDGQPVFKSGALVHLKDNILHIERRQRRARVAIPFIGGIKELTLSLLPEGDNDGQ